MKINAETYGHAVMLLVKGEIIEDSLDAFRQAVDHQLASEDILDVIINLEEVPFVDSAALEYLLDLQDRLAAKLGQVRLAKCDENLQKILEITDLASTFEVHAEIADAVKAVQA